MRITIQHTQECPNVERAAERIREALRQIQVETEIELEVVCDEEDARRLGFVGSPTILVDGRDPFGDPDASPALACRIYKNDAGSDGAPTAEQILEALSRRRKD